MSQASTPLTWGRRALLACFTAGCAAALAQSAWAPPRPIRVVVPYPAGGGTDIAARLVTAGVGNALGQPLVVDNKPGANGVIAADYVYGSPPDATTLLFGSADVISI